MRPSLRPLYSMNVRSIEKHSKHSLVFSAIGLPRQIHRKEFSSHTFRDFASVTLPSPMPANRMQMPPYFTQTSGGSIRASPLLPHRAPGHEPVTPASSAANSGNWERKF